MKLKWLFNNSHVIVSSLGVAAFSAGCCSKGTGGSYSSSSLPPYTENAAGGTAETQESTTSAQASTSTSGTQTIPLYKEQVNVGTRQVQDATVRIRKVVKTETVNEPVTLRKETLVIDRQPSSTGAESGAQPFQNQEITIPLSHDEPMVSTTVVPNGQIVAQTRADTTQQTIQQQVRSEDVAVDKGNAQNVIISDNVTKDQNQAAGAATAPGGEYSGSSTGPITDVIILSTTSDPTTLSGKQVQLNSAKIDRVTGMLIVIKDSSGNDVFIKSDQPTDSFHPGDTVNVTGTVTKTSPSMEGYDQMQGQKVVIHADSVQKAQ